MIHSEMPSADRLRALLEQARAQGANAQACKRLEWILHFAGNGGSISETCRHFGISRSTFHRWIERFDPSDLSTLEERSHEPRTVRAFDVSPDTAELIRQYRERFPQAGKERIAEQLQSEHGIAVPVSAVGRVIERECMYFGDTPMHWRKRMAHGRQVTEPSAAPPVAARQPLVGDCALAPASAPHTCPLCQLKRFNWSAFRSAALITSIVFNLALASLIIFTALMEGQPTSAKTPAPAVIIPAEQNETSLLNSLFGIDIASAATGIYNPINYQGKLTNTGGIAIANGTYNMRFKIFSAASGGSPVWTETWDNTNQRVTATGGLFSIALGTHTAMTGSVDFNSDSLYLQVEFDPANAGTYPEVFSPRRRFASVPYAHNADTLDGLNSTQFLRSDTDATASGTLTVSPKTASKVGVSILSTAGSGSIAALKISTQGANHILFGTGGTTYDTNLYRSAASTLKTDGNFTAGRTLSGARLTVSGNANVSGSLIVRKAISGAALEVLGTASGLNLFATQSISGTNLYAASTFGGAGLTSCSAGATSKLLWNAATKQFSCGTDQTGGSAGTASFSGSVLTLGDARYVKKQGDTMTGALTINLSSGYLGLKVLQTISGAFIHAEKGLSSSGTILATGSITTRNTLSGKTLVVSGNASVTGSLVSVGNITTKGTLSGRVLTVSGNGSVSGSLVVKKTISGAALEIWGTASGQNLFATQSISGTYLYAASTFGGAGLTSCSNATTSKLLWNSATKQFSCGTDYTGGSAGTASFSGSVLTLGDARYVKKQGDTMTGALIINITGGNPNTLGLRVLNTISGAVIRAQNTLASSGTLIVKKYSGTNTGNTVVIDTQGLVYDASNKRVGVGTASPKAMLDVVGTISGKTLTISGNASISGSLVAVGNITTKGTLSGRVLTVSGNGSVSGSLVVKKAISGAALEVLGTASGRDLFATQSISGTYLYAASTFGGAGLTSCSNATSSKLLYNIATKQFSCGTDYTGGSAGTASFSGSVLLLGDARYVKKQGDTMTGALTINLSSGYIGLKVLQTASGAFIHAEKGLSSSGTLVWEGAGSGRSLDLGGGNVSVSASGQTVFNVLSRNVDFTIKGATTNLFVADASADRVGIGTSAPKATLDVVGTLSGRSLVISRGASFSGSVLIGHAAADVVTFRSVISGSLLPAVTNTYSLGSDTLRWKNLFLSGAVSLGVSGDNGTIGYDTSGNRIKFDAGGDGTIDFRMADIGSFDILEASSNAPAVSNYARLFARPSTSGGNDSDTTYLINAEDSSGIATNTAQGKTNTNSHGGSCISNSATQAKFGSNSISLNCAGYQYYRFSSTNDDYFVTGDFTVDFWVYEDANTSVNRVLMAQTTYNDHQWALMLTSGNKLQGQIKTSTGMTVSITDATNFPTAQWVHVALERSGSTFRVYRDGTSVGSYTYAGALKTLSSRYLMMGNRYPYNFAGDQNFTGYVDETRISKIARYSGNFTPPTSAYAGDTGGLFVRLSNGRLINLTGSGSSSGGGGGDSVWTVNNDNSIYYSIGPVGVGVTLPLAQFEVLQDTLYGSGALLVDQNVDTGTGIYVDSIATHAPGIAISMSGAATALNPHLLFGYNNNFDTRLYRPGANKLMMNASLLPESTNAYDLGSGALRWRDLYLSGGTIYMGQNGDQGTIRYNTTTDTFNIDAGADGTNDLSVLATGQVGIGTTAPKAKLDVVGTISGSTLTISGNANISGALLSVGNITTKGTLSGRVLTVSGNGSVSGSLVVKKNISGAALEVLGTASGLNLYASRSITGTNIYAASTFGGAGLASCSNATTSKLLYNSATKQFSCGTDQNSTEVGTSSFSGATLRLGDARYVKKQGDTMTGALIINITGGNPNTLGLRVLNTISGSIIRAQNTLASSGTLIVKKYSGTNTGNTVVIDTQGLVYDASNKRVGIGTASPKAMLDVVGTISGKTLTISGNGSFSGSLVAVGNITTKGTLSGRLLTISGNSALSGTLIGASSITAKGTLSGKFLTVSSNATVSGTLVSVGNITTKSTLSGRLLTVSGNGSVSGSLVVKKSISGAALEVLGTASGLNLFATQSISGTHLYVANTFGGAGLTSCSNATTSKLLYNSATKQFSCGTDQTGGTGVAGTASFSGSVLLLGDARYVKKQGDTMTGALVINITGGTRDTVGLRIINTASGAHLHAQQLLTSSGTLVTESGAVFDAGTLYVDAVNNRVGVGTTSPTDAFTIGSGNQRMAAFSFIYWGTSAAGESSISAGTGDGNGFTFRPGGLGTSNQVNMMRNGSSLRMGVNTNGAMPSTTLEVIGTASGQNLFATYSVTGANLYAASTFGGAGLASCSNPSTSKLLWNSATKQFSCGTDQSGGGGTASFSGGVLTIGDARYVKKQGDTMTGALTINLSSGYLGLKVLQTISGAFIHAEKSLSSSGTILATGSITTRNTLSGKTLVVSGNASVTGSLVSVGNITTKGTLSGRVLTVSGNGSVSGSLVVKKTISGAALEVLGTASGRDLFATQSISGTYLYAASTFGGAGLTSCSNSTTSKLLWNAATGRFSCGTDQNSTEVGTGSFSGATLRLGDARYVKKSGDTMTGALTINVTGGNINTIGLKVINTISGGIVRAQQALVSSGSLYWRGAGTGRSLVLTDTISTGNAGYTPYNSFGAGTPSVASTVNDTYTAGVAEVAGGVYTSLVSVSNNALYATSSTGLVGMGTSLPKAKLDVVGTISGRTLTISGNGSFSGALVVKRSISGASLEVLGTASGRDLFATKSISGTYLYAASTFGGAGLADCQGGNKLLYNAATKQFSCGADQTAGTGLDVNTADARYVKKQGDTMTGALVINITSGNANTIGLKVYNTISGAIIHATQQLRSSGTILATGTITTKSTLSGRLLTVSGNGSVSGSLVVKKSISGAALEVLGTASGLNLFATQSISGTHLYVANTFGGAGLTSCSNATTSKLLYNSATKQFSCGSDQTGGGGAGTASFSGSVLLLGDARYVKKQGDTMTGALNIRPSAGTNTVALNVAATMSGRLLLVSGTGASTSPIIYTNAGNGRVGIGTTSPTAMLSIGSAGGQPSISNPTAGNGLVLAGSGGGVAGQLRIVSNGGGWADNKPTAYFQMRTVRGDNSLYNNNVTFMGGTYGADAVMDRLQFDSAYTSITDAAFGTTPVPTALLELINSTAGKSLLKLKGAASQTANLTEWQNSAGSVLASIDKTGSGFLAALGVGTTAPKARLDVQGTLSGKTLTISGNGSFSGSLTVKKNISGAALEVLGTASGRDLFATKSISGTYLYAASTFGGAGLTDCANGVSSKLLWSSATGRFSCGTDQSGSSGISMSVADERYVKKQGDTMTGALVINVSGGSDATLGLRVLNTISGSVIHAEKTLSSSGGLAVEGSAWVGSRLFVPDGTTSLPSIASVNDVDTGFSWLPGNNNLIQFSAGGVYMAQVSSNTFAVAQGTASFPTISTISGQNTGLYWPTTDSLGISTATVERLRILNNGNVGIGATAPGSKLSVSGAVIINPNGTLGTSSADSGLALEVIGTASGKDLFATKSISGTYLYAASTFGGAGLTSCSNATTSKLLYNSATKQFSCGTDQTGGSGVFGSGNVLTIGDARYVKKQGDTMTGALTINVTGGNINTVGLKVINTISGAVLHAASQLRSSGSLAVSSPGTPTFTIRNTAANVPAFYVADDGNNPVIAINTTDTSAAQFTMAKDTAGLGGIKVIGNGNGAPIIEGTDGTKTFQIGEAGFTRTNGTVMIGALANATQALEVLGTASGTDLFATKSISGTYLYAASTFGGAGLTSCSNATTSKLLYNSATKQFSCGTDQSGSSSFGSGNVLTIGDARYVKKQGDTMTGALTINLSSGYLGLKVLQTASGAFIHAEKSLSSSGTILATGSITTRNTLSGKTLVVSGNASVTGALVVRKTISGAALEVLGTASGKDLFATKSISGTYLYAASTFGGAGLTDCSNGTTAKLLWNAATGRFSCGTDQTGGGTGTFGSGNVLTIGDARYVKKSGDTMTGALTINLTSGSIGLKVLAGMSGNTLTVSKGANFSGSGIVFSSTGNTIFNRLNRNVDFTVRGQTDNNLLFVDASTDRVGIGTSLPKAKLEILGTLSGKTLTISGNGSFSGSLVVKKTISGAALEVLGTVSGVTLNATGTGAKPLFFTSSPWAGVGIGTNTPTQRLTVSGGSILNLAGGTVKTLSGVNLGAQMNDAVIVGRYAYVMQQSNTLQFRIVDIGNPLSPKIVSSLTVGTSNVNTLAVSGRYAYIGTSTSGNAVVRVVDISNPSTPVIIGSLDFGENANVQAMAVAGRYLYVGRGQNFSTIQEFQIVDISNPFTPRMISSVDMGSFPFGVNAIAVQGKYAYVGIDDDGGAANEFRIIDVSSPVRPVDLGGASLGAAVKSISVAGRYAYVGLASVAGNDFRILDISNPSSVSTVGGLDVSTDVLSVDVAGKYAYLGLTSVAGNDIRVVNINNPALPAIVGGTDISTSARKVIADGKFLYAGTPDVTGADFSVYDINGIDAPSASIGTLGVDVLYVGRNMSVANALSVATSINVGIGGIMSDGTLSITVGSGSTVGSMTGAIIVNRGMTGTVLALDSWRGNGTGSAKIVPHLLFGYRGTYDTMLYRAGSGVLANSGTLLLRGGTGRTLLKIESGMTSSADANVIEVFSNVNTGFGAPNHNRILRADGGGSMYSDGSFSGGGADYAERFLASTPNLQPGQAVCLDPLKSNTVKLCDRSGDPNVMGIISTKPAFVGDKYRGVEADGKSDATSAIVGLIGQLPAKAIVEDGQAIAVGDALATAAKPGFVRKAKAGESTVGVALTPLPSGEGMVDVLITRRNQSDLVEKIENEVTQSIADMHIEDDVRQMVQSVMTNADINGAVASAVQNQVQNLNLASQINAILDQRLADGSLNLGSQGTLAEDVFSALRTASGAKLVNDAVSARLGLSRTGSSALTVASDLLVPGALTVQHDVLIGGTLHAAAIQGPVRFDGPIVPGTDFALGAISLTGSTVQIGNLTDSGALQVVGNVTIDGLSTFLGGVEVRGELIVSANQAGFAVIPAHAKSVTVTFGTGFVSTPVVNATPNGRVGSEWWIDAQSQTGFTIRTDKSVPQDVRFSWTALGVREAKTAAGSASAEQMVPFHVDAEGRPYSVTDTVWNSCIRDPNALDVCRGYHQGTQWFVHPDIAAANMEVLPFTYDAAIGASSLVVPPTYELTVVESVASSSVSSSVSSQASSMASSEASSQAAASSEPVSSSTSSAMSSEAATSSQSASQDTASSQGSASSQASSQAAASSESSVSSQASSASSDAAAQ